ncbi:MAG: efflux RND transporter periplasmic adaptor subunit [Bryobacteraceae bacterium]|nr:efflux RND transporter periplasmic adaptor subunit [Bryobacteraceae bacterium]
MRYLGVFVAAAALAGCRNVAASDPPSPAPRTPPAADRPQVPRGVRATGKIRAVREYAVQVPRIEGQSPRMTLVRLAASGAQVQKDDVLAEFDRTQQIDNAREALAKYEDLRHQVDQKKAENRSNAEKRAEEMALAKAELAKAKIQLRIAPVLGQIKRLQNDVKLEDAATHIASLEKSHALRESADAAALKILELKTERQRLALERAERNAERLVLKAPLAGMVALENTWRTGSIGPAQVGDQLWGGQALLRIFDPTEMEVSTQIAEPDAAAMSADVRAVISLDAYPDLLFKARLISANPVASADLGSPIKRFTARFRIEGTDPHLMPDLSAAVVITRGEEAGP